MRQALRRFLKTGIGTAAAAAAAVFLVYLGWSSFGRPSPSEERRAAAWLLTSFSAGAAILGLRLAAGRRSFDPRLRRAWVPLALSALCNAAAGLFWLGLESGQPRPVSPTAADVLLLAFYPLRLAGMLALPFAALRRSERAILWLDFGIVFAAGFTGLWYFWGAPIWVLGDPQTSSMFAIAYPLANLMAAAGLVMLAERDVARLRLGTGLLLAMNFALVALANTGLAYFGARSLPGGTTALNAIWAAAGLCDFLAVAWMLSRGQNPHAAPAASAHPARRWLRLMLPYLAMLLGLAVLVIASLSDPPQPRAYLAGTVFGSLALMGLAMLRQFVVLRENIALQEETSRLATIDGLTGLSNRRTLDQALEKEVERALRYTHPLTILMLDVDGFKAFNDRHGHLEGDSALRRICECLRAQVRSTDLLARFGGDEFVLLLPETTWEGAVAAGAKMRESTRGLLFSGSPLGLSIGVAEYRQGMTPRDLLVEADQSLYRAKRGIGQLELDPARPPHPLQPEGAGG